MTTLKQQLRQEIEDRRSRRSADERDRSAAPLVVACSGGPDSLALAAAARYVVRDAPVHGLVVDHGLQDGSASVAARAAALAAQIADPALRKAQGIAALAQEAANQAYVMAYNDAYRLTAAVALAALVALTLHIWRDAMVARRLRRAPKAPIPESQA